MLASVCVCVCVCARTRARACVRVHFATLNITPVSVNHFLHVGEWDGELREAGWKHE